MVEGTDISKDIRKRNIPESLDTYTDPTPVQGTGDEQPIGYSAHSESPNEWGELLKTDGTEDTEDEDAIMVGVVGSAAPWFLTGWTNDVEVEPIRPIMGRRPVDITITPTETHPRC